MLLTQVCHYFLRGRMRNLLAITRVPAGKVGVDCDFDKPGDKKSDNLPSIRATFFVFDDDTLDFRGARTALLGLCLAEVLPAAPEVETDPPV